MTKPISIVIVGPERSGTSAIASVFSAMGFNMGDNIGANHEDKVFIRASFEERKLIIQQRDRKYAFWGIKYPAFAYELCDYIDLFQDAKVLVVTRKVGEWISSRGKYDLETPEQALKQLAEFYETIAAQISRLKVPVVFLDYEDFIRFPERELRECFVKFGLKIDQKTFAKTVAAAFNESISQKGYKASKGCDYLIYRLGEQRSCGSDFKKFQHQHVYVFSLQPRLLQRILAWLFVLKATRVQLIMTAGRDDIYRSFELKPVPTKILINSEFLIDSINVDSLWVVANEERWAEGTNVRVAEVSYERRANQLIQKIGLRILRCVSKLA